MNLFSKSTTEFNRSRNPKAIIFGENGGSGTIIKLTNWWHTGGPNSDNPKKTYSTWPGKVRDILGRRYATLLRPGSSPRFKITVKNDTCIPFEHCVWAEHRFVKRVAANIPHVKRLMKYCEHNSDAVSAGSSRTKDVAQ